MSTNCNQGCEGCSSAADCKDRKDQPKSLQEPLHQMSSVKKVIGVVSGKGGVGKSLVTSLMAVTMNRRGHHTAILDADITGPSIPKAFGMKGRAKGTEFGLLPTKSSTGIDVMSVNLLLNNETDPVVWRGPIIAGTVKQFWTDVIWEDVDYMFVDMPPGTGDVPMTVFQSLPVDGIIIVTSPQELVTMIVEKAVKMAHMMKIPILGIVENLSYFVCPDCGGEHTIYGESHIEEVAKKNLIPVYAKIPIDRMFAAACDMGMIENYEGSYLDQIADSLESLIK